MSRYVHLNLPFQKENPLMMLFYEVEHFCVVNLVQMAMIANLPFVATDFVQHAVKTLTVPEMRLTAFLWQKLDRFMARQM